MNNPSLKNTSVFQHQKLIANLPDKVFVIALFITLSEAFLFFKLGILLGLPLSIAFAYLIFKPLYLIHQNDLNAWRIYLKTLHTPTALDARYTTPKHMLVVKGKQLLSIQDI
ncbi:hypothetical protein [Vibrio algivorus]|uniref:PrgI family protein n=1 Tax=Vibrio algivorus TaxID=1667024 RepID=A0A557PGZ4_9VIBR|nr:hypothetical protein [Vibrio algivorus]TVO39924.1 hypothetical protein FOF44_00195 [Vibrio algivorus]